MANTNSTNNQPEEPKQVKPDDVLLAVKAVKTTKVTIAALFLILLTVYIVSSYTGVQVAILLLITAIGICIAAMIAWAIDTVLTAIGDSGLFNKD